MENLELFKLRAEYANNDRQRNRMSQDKLKSLQRALLYSYQSGWIRKDFSNENYVRALINPDKIKFDYDEKIVSVEYEYNFKCGDSFEWPKLSGVHWLIYKQEITELAYFRGSIRRCQEVTFIHPDTKETVKIWAAIRGPVETKLNTIQKSGIVADVPNLTLNLYMPNNELNQRVFARYQTFAFAGRFWQVVATDDISTVNILEINALEDYDCKSNELLTEVVDPNVNTAQNEVQIVGQTFVKPLEKHNYSIGLDDGEWSITLPASNNKEIEDVLEYTVQNDGSIDITWVAMISGSYIIHYGEIEKTIVVESLF